MLAMCNLPMANDSFGRELGRRLRKSVPNGEPRLICRKGCSFNFIKR